jgi:hypothetical protein
MSVEITVTEWCWPLTERMVPYNLWLYKQDAIVEINLLLLHLYYIKII